MKRDDKTLKGSPIDDMDPDDKILLANAGKSIYVDKFRRGGVKAKNVGGAVNAFGKASGSRAGALFGPANAGLDGGGFGNQKKQSPVGSNGTEGKSLTRTKKVRRLKNFCFDHDDRS